MDWYLEAMKRLDWVEVTVWYAGGSHNHIEIGHSSIDKPVGHKSWAGYKWSKLLTYAIKDSKPLMILD